MKIIFWALPGNSQQEESIDYILNIQKPEVGLIQHLRRDSLQKFKNGYNLYEYQQEEKNIIHFNAFILKDLIGKEILIPYKNYYEGSEGVKCLEIETKNNIKLTLVNIYGKIDSKSYTITTMHHIVSDITPIVNSDKNIILGLLFTNILLKIKGRKLLSNKQIYDRLEEMNLEKCSTGAEGEEKKNMYSNFDLFISKNLNEHVISCKRLKTGFNGIEPIELILNV